MPVLLLFTIAYFFYLYDATVVIIKKNLHYYKTDDQLLCKPRLTIQPSLYFSLDHDAWAGRHNVYPNQWAISCIFQSQFKYLC